MKTLGQMSTHALALESELGKSELSFFKLEQQQTMINNMLDYKTTVFSVH